jgi:membrane protein
MSAGGQVSRVKTDRGASAGIWHANAGIQLISRLRAADGAMVATRNAEGMGLLDALRVPLSWREVFRRVGTAIYTDNLLGWAAELAYYSFLALFPALLFFVALASFFPIHDFTGQVVSTLSPFAPAEVLKLLQDQLNQISKSNNGGLLTLGLVGTIWSASSGMSSVISTLNQVYHVQEGRSWWRVRSTAIGLTIALAVFILVSFALVLVGPAAADKIADMVGLGAAFRWTWKIVQWPVLFLLVATGIAMVYYIAPDVKQEWVWITPGSVLATIIWLLVSLGFKWYVSAFANYQATYGAIGGVIVALLWLYLSGLAILIGATMNAVIEHASPLGKDPGEKVAGEKELHGGIAPHQAPRSASGRAPLSRRPVVTPGAPVRLQAGCQPRPTLARASDFAIGAVGIALELTAIVAMRLRRVRRRL